MAIACAQAFTRRHGAANKANLPLPRKPLTETHSISIPASGTRRDSSPHGVPTQITCNPKPRITSATDRPGKTCPPVPPAAINTGLPPLAAASCLKSRTDAFMRTSCGPAHLKGAPLGQCGVKYLLRDSSPSNCSHHN